MENMLKEVLNEVKTLNGKFDLLENGQNSLVAKTDSLVAKTDYLTAVTDSLVARTDSLVAVTDSLVARTDSLVERTDSLAAVTDSLVARTDCLATVTDSLAAHMKSGFDAVNRRLDKICVQVAHNTEQEIRLNEVVARVELLETDTKILKQLVVNK